MIFFQQLLINNTRKEIRVPISMVEFDKTMDDLAALVRYTSSRQKGMRRARMVGLVLWIIFPFAFFFFTILVYRLPLKAFLWPPITIFFMVMIGLSIYNAQKYAIFSRFLKRSVQNYMKNRDYSKEIGPDEITIGPKGIKRKNRYIEEKMKWEGIIRITETKDHVFFFVTDSTAYIIPMRAFKKKKEKGNFIREAHDLWDRSRA